MADLPLTILHFQTHSNRGGKSDTAAVPNQQQPGQKRRDRKENDITAAPQVVTEKQFSVFEPIFMERLEFLLKQKEKSLIYHTSPVDFLVHFSAVFVLETQQSCLIRTLTANMIGFNYTLDNSNFFNKSQPNLTCFNSKQCEKSLHNS